MHKSLATKLCTVANITVSKLLWSLPYVQKCVSVHMHRTESAR